MKIYHLNGGGSLGPRGGRLWDGHSRLFDHASLVCHVLLIALSDEHLVLVDTGLGQTAVHQPRRWLGRSWVGMWRPRYTADNTVVAQIEQLGYSPGNVRDIVLTHMDLDHSGGLADFSRARIHLHNAELAALRNKPTFAETQRYRDLHVDHDPIWSAFLTGAEHWFGFEAATLPGLPPSILAVSLPGHSRGHIGVAVDTTGSETLTAASLSGARWLLHAGDAYMGDDEIGPDRFYCPPGLAAFQAFAAIGPERKQTRDRLRALIQEHRRQVASMPAHPSSVRFDQLQRATRQHVTAEAAQSNLPE